MGLLMWIFIAMGGWTTYRFWETNITLSIITIVAIVIIFWTGTAMSKERYEGATIYGKYGVWVNILVCIYVLVVFVLSFILYR